MKAQIENLKTELRKFIELSKQVSPSKWTVSYGPRWIEHDAKFKVALSYNNDAAFIARSRNISPAMAKCLLAAVDGLAELHLAEDAGKESGAFEKLTQILTIWEAGK